MTNNKKCLANECENPAFKEMDKCALHCEKGDYSKDFNSMLLNDFYDLFVQYIYEYLNSSVFGDKVNLSLGELKEFCNKDEFSNEKRINGLNDKVFVPTNIVFPARKDIDFFDYTKLLRLFKSIHFNYCEFSCTSLELDDVGVFFQDCIFHSGWSLFDYKVLANIDDVTYQNCVFKKDVSVYTPDDEWYVITNNQFDFSCVFKEKLSIENTDISAALFSSRQLSEGYILLIKALKLENARINGRFLINNLTAEKLYFKDVEFNEKFEFKNSNVAQVMIDNTNFIKVADFFGSTFESFKVEKCIFEQFVGFEKCKFGEESEGSKASALFKYVTFNDYFNFRSASFFVPISLNPSYS